VPVPHREDTLVQRQRRGGLLLLLRLPRLWRCHLVRPGRRSPRFRGRRALPGRSGRHHAARGPGGGARPPTALRVARRDGAGGVVVPRAPAAVARRGPGAGLPALTGLRRRRGPQVPAGLGARRLGCAGEGVAALDQGPVRLGPRLRQPARARPGLLPLPDFVPDLRPLGPADRARGPHPPAPSGSGRAGAPGTEVQELAGVADLHEAPDALRVELGQARRHRTGRGRRVRGLHRRHRVLPGRRAVGGGNVRHRAGRGALHAPAQLRQAHRPGVRRGHGRAERDVARLRVGAQARGGRGGGGTARRVGSR